MRSAVTVFVVVLLAGCSLFGGTGTPTETTPTGTPTATATPVEPANAYPPGYAAEGVVDPAAALDANSDALLAADSFFLEYAGTAISEGRTASVYSAQVVNVSADRAYVISVVRGGGSSVQYYAGDTVYVQSDPRGENNTRYYSRNVSVEPSAFTGRGFYGPLLRYVDWGSANRTGDKDTFVRYRGDSLERVKPVLGADVEPSNVTNFTASLLVGPDGTIHRIVYGATIVRASKSEVGVAITTRRVGNTTVEEPTWLDRARS